MPSNNPLLPIWESYQTTRAALIVAKKATQHLPSQGLLDDTHLALQSSGKTRQSIQMSLKDCEELFVLSLWASFERFVRNYLQQKSITLQTTLPPVLGYAMYAYLEKEIEFWNSDDILEQIIKEVLSVHKALASQAKHILHYRNWVAHGKNPNVKNKPSRIPPQFAYNTLKDIIDLLLVN